MSSKDHWENVYVAKNDAEVSWTQPDPQMSLALIKEVCRPRGSVIDVGGGTSVLAKYLLEAGYTVAVLDIAETALARSRERLGERAGSIRWIVADIIAVADLGQYDVWHDRAVFHFLTDPADRARYVALLARSVPPQGHAIIATFAPDGPEKCSGLPVQRYDGQLLAAELGARFELLRSVPETHLTPRGKPQSFQYSMFKRV